MSALAKVDLPYVHAYQDRHGKRRLYFRRRGFKKSPLPGAPGSTEFAAAYQHALEAAKPSASSPTEGPRSVGALIAQYYLSPDWRALEDITHKGYRSVLERFRAKYGPRPAADLKAIHMNAIYQTMTSAGASVLRKRLGPVFDLAEDLGWRPKGTNPARQSKKLKYKTKGFAPYTEEDIAKFEAKYGPGTKERLALYLFLYTGQRRGNVCKMGRQHVEGGRISVVAVKTGARLKIKLHPKLKAELDLAPLGMTFLLTERGRPFSPDSLGHWFRDKAKDAGIEGKATHGLRKAQGRRLAEMGCSAHVIMAVLGHASLTMAQYYTKDVNQMDLADAGIDALTQAEPKENDVANLGG